jgi:three-Cys-motif partner protein
MTADDQKHFNRYREQTRVKHAILEKYLVSYFNILKKSNSNLVYIDGFAGSGTYTCCETGNSSDGSPLRALAKIASSNGLSSIVSTIFIERDRQFAQSLQEAVSRFCATQPELRQPMVRCGPFAGELEKVLNVLEQNGRRLAPTFLFVDPCGVAGVRFSVLRRFMQQRSCEILVFFNIDGVRRILGLGKSMGSTIVELVGSEEKARELQTKFQQCHSPAEREELIVAFYQDLVRSDIDAEYVTAFRVEREDRRVTSHYIIHATRHQTGFRVMKEVMWGVGQTREGRGGLALEQASLKDVPLLIAPQWQEVRQEVLTVLKEAPRRQAKYFYQELAERPGNRLCRNAYRMALLELEKEGHIEVLDKAGVTPMPVHNRRPYKGEPTLAEDYYVRAM